MLGFKSKVDVVALDNKQNIRKAPSMTFVVCSQNDAVLQYL